MDREIPLIGVNVSSHYDAVFTSKYAYREKVKDASQHRGSKLRDYEAIAGH